eukprot:CAMPEP_0194562982 /NCGR_PEP_ID=MMETSP0292-20121207/3216_1 /TAXON_ID=39354 /ORGANISM="Heterosigma akashiwo, Strain CCMP2393" /LENGTH=151 /DNA_ID=CAMNT_0039411813 /DNA_START=125 /DNA_END=577 /DNA_ORIENTATION=-
MYGAVPTNDVEGAAASSQQVPESAATRNKKTIANAVLGALLIFAALLGYNFMSSTQASVELTNLAALAIPEGTLQIGEMCSYTSSDGELFIKASPIKDDDNEELATLYVWDLTADALLTKVDFSFSGKGKQVDMPVPEGAGDLTVVLTNAW